jgi:serine/threonine protein kinase
MSMAITFKPADSSLVSKRFEIRSTLGTGGFGVVYLAFDRDLGAQVALKTLHHINPRSLYRFKQEFRSLADIAHPNLATLYELIREESLWYFTMELVDGVDFLRWVSRRESLPESAVYGDTTDVDPRLSDTTQTVEGSAEELRRASMNSLRNPSMHDATGLYATLRGDTAELAARMTMAEEDLTEKDMAADAEIGEISAQARTAPQAPMRGLAVDLPRLYAALAQLTRGVAALHEYGKLHRDIKPSNVLVAKDGRVVLLDFGMVVDFGASESPLQKLERESNPNEVTFAGTPRYMSPEQAMGEELDEASDWYSIGVMLYEALSGGRPPVEGSTNLQILLRKQSVEPPPIAEIVAGVPPELGALCMGLLRVDPTERPGGREILEVLGSAQFSKPRSSQTSASDAPIVDMPADSAANLPLAPNVQTSHLSGGNSGAAHFVGRAGHLQELRRALRSSVVGNRLAVANIHGASGMGKTTLVRRFIESLGEGSNDGSISESGDIAPVVLQGRCHQNESMPYKALDSLMDELSTFLHRFDAAELGAWIGADVCPLTRVFPGLERAPAIRELLEATRSAAGWEDAPSPDAQLLREQAFRGLRNLLDGLARKHSLLLYIDDVQWGDEDSAMLLKELLGPPNPPPLFLMTTWRSEDAPTSPFLSAFLPLLDSMGDELLRLDVHVDELSEEESVELVASLLDAGPQLSDKAGIQESARTTAQKTERVEAIAREARGNPFFIDELARYSRTYDTGPDSDMTSLGDVIFRRVSQLAAPARRLLEVLAVAGQPLDRRVARTVAAIDEDVQSALATLRGEHLVRVKSTRDYEWLEPYHARVGETLLARLSESARVDYHRELASALEARGHFDPEAVARHFLAAGNREKGGHYSLLAARRAEEALAFEHAARLYSQALDAREWPEKRAEILKQLGVAYGYLGRGQLASDAFAKAAELSGDAKARELTIRAAEQLLRSGRYDRGMAIIEDVLRGTGFEPPRSTAQMMSSILWKRFRLLRRDLDVEPRPRDAIPADEFARIDALWTAAKMLASINPILGGYYHYHTIHAVLDAGSAEHLTLALCQQAAQEAATGPNLEFAAEVLDRAEAFVQASSEPDYVRSYIEFMRGFCEFATGNFREGRRRIRQAGALLRERCNGVIWEIGSFKFFEFLPALWLGDFTAFADEIPKLLEHAADRNDTFHRVALRTWQYPAHLHADAPHVARAELAQAISEWTREGYHIQHFWYLQGAVDTALYEGDSARARQLLAEHYRPMKRSMLLRNEIIRVSVWNLQARSALAALRDATADSTTSNSRRRALLRESRKLINKLRNPKHHRWTHPLADLLQAELCVIEENPDAASALYEKAEAGLIANDLQLYARAARRRRGELLGGTDGHELVASATSWMHARGIQNPPAMTRMLAGETR